MDLRLTPEQDLLRDSARRLLSGHLAAVTRRLRQGGPADDAAPWDASWDASWDAVRAAGWPALGLPVEQGGAGTLLDLAVVMEEAGRALAPTTLRSTTFAARVVREVDPRRPDALLEGLASGDVVGSVALEEPAAEVSLDALATTVEPADAGLVVEGVKAAVPDADRADVLLVVANRGRDVVAVPRSAEGVRLTPVGGPGRERLHRVQLDRCRLPEHARLGRPGAARPGLERAVTEATALLAAELVGGAAAVVERTVAHVTNRVQFGRPIGTFQAVQHQLADRATAVDAARLAVLHAVWSLQPGGDPAAAVAVARFAAGDAFKDATLVAHQLHGGMGYVREDPLHLWSEAAKAGELTLGNRDHHLARLADRLLSGP